MRLRLAKDATFMNGVANHPDVRPWLGLDGKSAIDLQPLLDLPGAFALQNEWGGIVFVLTGDGAYEFHTQFLPEGRGKRALLASQEACRMLFEDFSAPSLQTYVPHGNLAARRLIQFLGFRETRSDQEQSYWCLTRNEWKARTAPSSA